MYVNHTSLCFAVNKRFVFARSRRYRISDKYVLNTLTRDFALADSWFRADTDTVRKKLNYECLKSCYIKHF